MGGGKRRRTTTYSSSLKKHSHGEVPKLEAKTGGTITSEGRRRYAARYVSVQRFDPSLATVCVGAHRRQSPEEKKRKKNLGCSKKKCTFVSVPDYPYLYCTVLYNTRTGTEVKYKYHIRYQVPVQSTSNNSTVLALVGLQ